MKRLILKKKKTSSLLSRITSLKKTKGNPHSTLLFSTRYTNVILVSLSSIVHWLHIMHYHTSVSGELKREAPLFSFNWIFLHQICLTFYWLFWIPCYMLRFTLTTLVQTLRPLISGHVTRSLLVCDYEDTLGALAISDDHWMGHVFIRAGVLSLLSFLQLINKIIKFKSAKA